MSFMSKVDLRSRRLPARSHRRSQPAHAQWKPTKTVDVIVHTGPGGGSDLLARAIATMMEKEKLLPVRMQVSIKPGRQRRGCRRGDRRAQGRPAHASG